MQIRKNVHLFVRMRSLPKVQEHKLPGAFWPRRVPALGSQNLTLVSPPGLPSRKSIYVKATQYIADVGVSRDACGRIIHIVAITH